MPAHDWWDSAWAHILLARLRQTQLDEEVTKGSDERPQSEVRRVLCMTESIFLTAVTGRIQGLIQRHLEVT